MERRRLRSQQQQATSPPARESLVSWVSETTRASMEYPVSFADSSSANLDSQNSDNSSPAYIPGQIITTCRPFVHIVTEEMKGRICDLCLRPPSSSSSTSSACSNASNSNSSSKLRCCSDCQAMFFCGSCLASTTPSIFKALHKLECPIYATYSSALSNPSKFFLRLYLRLANPESIPHTQSGAHYNPLTREELDFEQLVPRLVYSSREEMTEHIKDFCERNRLKINAQGDSEPPSSEASSSISSSSSKGAKNRKNKKKNKSANSLENTPTYQSVADFRPTDSMSVEDIAIFQFMNLLEEFSHVEPLLGLISDDTHIYHLWKVFVRLWSYATPIVDEFVSGILSDSSSSAIAYGLYLEPNSILFGHSCLPNTALAFYGPVLQLRAMKHIYPGDSLLSNLVQLAVPQAERLRQLRSYFISTCFCARCRGKSQVAEEDDEEAMDCDGVLSVADYDAFRSLKDEFTALFETAFTTSVCTKSPLSLSAILHFNSGGEDSGADDLTSIGESSRQCDQLHSLAERMQPLYEKIYPFLHPEKSRFAYAHTVVEMNRLLFKLDGRAAEASKVEGREDANSTVQQQKEKKSKVTFDRLSTASSTPSASQSTPNSRKVARMSDFSASVSPRAGNLDALTEEITAWSTQLKATVKAIRFTHGIDHRLYREVAVPLAPLWSRALARSSRTHCSAQLSLDELHRDPAVLLRMLVYSGSGSPRSRQQQQQQQRKFSIGSHLEVISGLFGQLFSEVYEGGEGGGKSNSLLEGVLKNVAPIVSEETAEHCWQAFCRALLVFFALLFPLFIYYVVYVEEL